MASGLFALKTLFVVMTCIMGVTLAYGLATDRYPFASCFSGTAWWTEYITTDVMVFMGHILVWYFYKEPSWIKRLIFAFIFFWCGSFVTCGYIAMELFKLSTDESSNDQIYVLLGGHPKGDVTGRKRRHSVVIAGVIVAILGCYVLGLFIYACIILGSPFHAKIFLPCVTMSTVDVLIHVVVFSLWIAYKESSDMNAFLWILSLVFFRSVALCVYMLRQLYYLAPGQSIYLILFKESNRDIISDPLLTEHANV